MDSIPQEIIDEIIDNLPTSSLRSSPLVSSRELQLVDDTVDLQSGDP